MNTMCSSVTTYVWFGVLVLGDATRPADGAEEAPVGDVHDACDLRVVHRLEPVQVVAVKQVPHFDHAIARAGDEPAARIVHRQARDLLAAVCVIERECLSAGRQVPRDHTRVVAASDHLQTHAQSCGPVLCTYRMFVGANRSEL